MPVNTSQAGYIPTEAFQNKLPDTGYQGINICIVHLHKYCFYISAEHPETNFARTVTVRKYKNIP